jgi:hypothetical protein
MDAGTTFLRSNSDKHLWIIISDPKVDAENILSVNLTSLDVMTPPVRAGVASHPPAALQLLTTDGLGLRKRLATHWR